MSRHPNAQLIHDFYEAFARHDAETMGAAYHDDATFSDPVFRSLDAAGARAMWALLTSGKGELRVEHSNVTADDDRGSAHWEAWYAFTPTGRKVHNIIEAEFEFRDGKIVRHTDSFDLYRWMKMAFGPAGTALGWTPVLPFMARRMAMKNLRKFQERRSR